LWYLVKPNKYFVLENFVEEFREKIFLERLLLISKSFSTFGNIGFQGNIGLISFGKISHSLKPCELKKGII